MNQPVILYKMNEQLEKKMRRNITLLGPYRVFTKRVFLPLTTIYASQVAGLNIAQIGYTVLAATLVSLLLDTVTGFWADQHGRSKSAKVGSLLAVLGSLLFILIPNFWGILAATVILAAGYAFMNGCIEALVHDSLIVLNEEHNYAKVAARSQSLSLVVSAAILAVVPLLYPIDERLPFLAGVIAYIILYVLASLLAEPPVRHEVTSELKRFFPTVRKLVNHKTILFFACAGFIYSANVSTSDIANLGFIELGLKPSQMGMIFAAASLLGAAVGLVVHHLKNLSFKQFATLDLFIGLMMYVSFGFIGSLQFAIGAFLLNMALWRYQRIMYQHYMLEIYGTIRHKATLFSLVSNFGTLTQLFFIVILTQLAQKAGILPSLGYFSVFLLLFWPVLIFSIGVFSKNAKTSSSTPSQ